MDFIAGRIVDLSMDIYHGAPAFPNDPECKVIVHNTVESIGYNITQLSLSTHHGTHLDAPFHFLNGGATVDNLPLESFVGEALLADMTHRKPKEPITVEDFLPFDKMIGKGSRVVFRTGWDKRYPDKSYFSDFPYLSKELADWFASKEIAMLGMDIPTPNPVDWMSIHHALLGKGIVILEALANLEQVTKDKFIILAAPLKIKGRDGSPVRALAIV